MGRKSPNATKRWWGAPISPISLMVFLKWL